MDVDRPPRAAGSTGRNDDRLTALLAAQRVITSDLSLTSMLDRIVSVACALCAAGYAALAVLGADGLIERFVEHGRSARTDPAGPLPESLLAATAGTPP